MIDADSFLEAMEKPPQIMLRGRIYTGVHLSFEEWERFAPRLIRMHRRELGSREAFGLVYDMLSAAFPHPRWKFWKLSVAHLVLRLPLPARMGVWESFLELEARVNGKLNPGPTAGNSSPREEGAPHREDGSSAAPADTSPPPSASPASSASTDPASTTTEAAGPPATE